MPTEMKKTKNSSRGKIKKTSDIDNGYNNNDVPPLDMNKFRKTQACDRCRLKKIKCDGLQPKCSNCIKINFSCITSDKLARRGFPKGYTEALEKEVVRLQHLLNNNINYYTNNDEKDELMKKNLNELNFSFINDNFHKFNNFSIKINNDKQVFLGHRTWNHFFNGEPDSINNPNLLQINELNNNNDFDNDFLLNLIKKKLRLNSINFILPQFVINKYKNDLNLIKSLLIKSIKQFFLTMNSLIPILYPFDIIETKLIDLINNPINIDIFDLLTLQYIIQINWNCHDNLILYQLTNLIINSSLPNIKIIQCLNLSIYYFMGSIPNLDNTSKQIIVIDLLNLNYSKLLTMALYINPKNLIPLNNQSLNKKIINNDENDSIFNVSFWCYQFLNSWWSLIQGLPKTNFLIDEFQPKELDIPILKSFNFLIDLIVKTLDGSNLIMILTNSERSKLILTIENFRKTLMNFKLYHNYHDHDHDLLTTDILIKNSLILEKTEFIEINLTLYYLTFTLLTELSNTNDNNNSIEKKKENKNTNSIEDICYEILSLYYLLILHFNPTNNPDNEHQEQQQPLKFNVLHFLPLETFELISLCEEILNNWARKMSRLLNATTTTNKTEKEYVKTLYYWKLNKFKKLLTKWSLLWYQNDLTTLEKQPFIKTFNIDLSIFEMNENFQKFNNPSTYLKQVNDFLNSNYNISYNNSLLRTDSKAIMDQFNMFAPSNNNLSSIFKTLNSPKLNDLNKNIFIATEDQQQPTTENNNNNSLYLLSPLLISAQDETDDGYAEDDDEGSSDNMAPLEFPFKTKRRASLFQQQHCQPPNNTNHTNVSKNKFSSSVSSTALHPLKKLKSSTSNYMFDKSNKYLQTGLPPLSTTNSLLNSRQINQTQPYSGTSVTSISQLLINEDEANDERQLFPNDNLKGKEKQNLPALTEAETPRSVVNMLLLSSSVQDQQTNKEKTK